MISVEPGSSTSLVEVGPVTATGFWLLLPHEELFLSYAEFPWFRNALRGQLQHVELLNENHLFWPDLDVDLEVDAILHPERYPLKARPPVQTPAA